MARTIEIMMPLTGSGTVQVELPRGVDPDDLTEDDIEEMFHDQWNDDEAMVEVTWSFTRHVCRGNVTYAELNAMDFEVNDG